MVSGLFWLQSRGRSIAATLGMTKSGYPWREKGVSLRELTQCPDQIRAQVLTHVGKIKFLAKSFDFTDTAEDSLQLITTTPMLLMYSIGQTS